MHLTEALGISLTRWSLVERALLGMFDLKRQVLYRLS